ncbi:cholecystokinin [Trichomycterus rosablanca]|uniref:cholecystokinin n=1 Tax=Trichomycterus rosablanca TaxID=2290929 RepID=UPI002F3544A4
MNSGVCVCVLLAALSISWAARIRSPSAQEENPAVPSQIHTDVSAVQDANSRANIKELMARLFRKGSVRRNSAVNKASALSPQHRIKDRDYLGWMDFGRRSAEEYEYSS